MILLVLINNMIGHQDDNEEVQYKVADKRKFNPDGSLREGVTIETTTLPKEPVPAEQPDPKLASAAEPSSSKPEQEDEFDEIPADAEDAGEDELDDIPGAKDPASFVNFLSTLATNAAAALGAVPHPATGKRSLDLESGKYWLDVLAMLRDKTAGNLHPKESALLESLLGDMRMQYVHLVRATEEHLKAQAAAKFSGEDILGRK